MRHGTEPPPAMSGGLLAVTEVERARMEANRRIAALETEWHALLELRDLLAMEERDSLHRLTFAREQCERLAQTVEAASERARALEHEQGALARRIEELERNCAQNEAMQRELAGPDASMGASVAALREDLSTAAHALETERETLERMDRAISLEGVKRRG